VANKANIDAPTFTGIARAVTPALNDNSTKIATTESVIAQIAASAPTTAVSTTYATAIPFTGIRYMPMQVVSAPITFTVNTTGSVIGGECQLALQADGSSAITFTGFTLASTQAYDNTAGRINNISFFRGPDGGYYYGVILGAATDLTAPTLLSAVVANAAPTVVALTFSESLSGTLAAAGAFTVSGHTVSSRAAGATANIVNLTVSSGFVNGEAARTVAYTQPGSNDLQDASGNKVANFSSVAITNNVADTTAPTVTAVAVANATPTKVRITFSEAILSTMPVTTAFTVSGHTVSGITYVDSTHIDLTVSVAFVTGETRTLAYTQPGTNDIQDLAGNKLANFSGTSITDNVTTGILTDSGYIAVASTLDATAVGTTDWLIKGNGHQTNLVYRKNGGAATFAWIGTSSSDTSVGVTYSFTDGDAASPSTTTVTAVDYTGAINMPSGSTETGYLVSGLAIGTVEQIVDVYFQINGGTATMLATLSDGAATLAGFSISGGSYANQGRRFHVKGGSGATLSLRLSSLGDSQGVEYIKGVVVVVYPA
jgi:methionine-rich copper-binding protein CopC